MMEMVFVVHKSVKTVKRKHVVRNGITFGFITIINKLIIIF